jgi:hypothetical protein
LHSLLSHPGQNWVELPGSHHLPTENTSPTKPAKLLVIFISDTGAKLKIMISQGRAWASNGLVGQPTFSPTKEPSWVSSTKR